VLKVREFFRRTCNNFFYIGPTAWADCFFNRAICGLQNEIVFLHRPYASVLPDATQMSASALTPYTLLLRSDGGVGRTDDAVDGAEAASATETLEAIGCGEQSGTVMTTSASEAASPTGSDKTSARDDVKDDSVADAHTTNRQKASDEGQEKAEGTVASRSHVEFAFFQQSSKNVGRIGKLFVHKFHLITGGKSGKERSDNTYSK